MKVKSLSHVQLLVTPWTAAYQAPPSMGLSRQEYWSGVLLPSLNCTGRINKNDYCFLRKETKRLESEGRQLLTVHLVVCFLTFVSFACIPGLKDDRLLILTPWEGGGAGTGLAQRPGNPQIHRN